MDTANETLYAIAPQLATLVIGASVNLAELIEQDKDVEKTKSLFRDSDFQLIVTESAILFLHIVDREVFRLFGPEFRTHFMNQLVLTVSKQGSTTAMTRNHPLPPFVEQTKGITISGFDTDLYNLRQKEYSRCKLFPGEGEPRLTGKLTWAFGKYVKEICDKYDRHPASQFEAMTIADSTYPHLAELLVAARAQSPAQ